MLKESLQQSLRLVTEGQHSSQRARLTFLSNSDEEEATEGSGTTMPDRITLILLFHLPPPPLLIFLHFHMELLSYAYKQLPMYGLTTAFYIL